MIDFFIDNETMINLVGWGIMLASMMIHNDDKNKASLIVSIFGTLAWIATLFNVIINGIIKGF